MCWGRIQHEEPADLFRPSPHGCPWDGAQWTGRNLMKQCNMAIWMEPAVSFRSLQNHAKSTICVKSRIFPMRPVATQVASQMFQHHHAEYISSIDIHIYGQWISTNRKHQHDVGQLLQVFDVCFSVKPDTSTKLIICANTVRLGRYALSQICHTFEHHITKETFRNSWQRCMLVINLFPTVARTQEHNKTSWFLAESMSFATPA